MDAKGWYNGYDWGERNAKLKALKARMARGELEPAQPPCDLCGDPEVPVEYHDEDYSKPYLWGPPALFKLCRNCHRDKLHKRFTEPDAWKAFLAHVRRGGYARDLKDLAIKREVEAYQDSLAGGLSIELRLLRPYSGEPGAEWFASLSLDPVTLSGSAARPRP